MGINQSVSGRSVSMGGGGGGGGVEQNYITGKRRKPRNKSKNGHKTKQEKTTEKERERVGMYLCTCAIHEKVAQTNSEIEKRTLCGHLTRTVGLPLPRILPATA